MVSNGETIVVDIQISTRKAGSVSMHYVQLVTCNTDTRLVLCT